MALGESGVTVVETMMTTLKTVTIAAVLLAGGTSLAMAEYGGCGIQVMGTVMGTRAPRCTTTQVMGHRPRQERPLLS